MRKKKTARKLVNATQTRVLREALAELKRSHHLDYPDCPAWRSCDCDLAWAIWYLEAQLRGLKQ